MKKIICIALTLVMLLGLAVSASAAAPTFTIELVDSATSPREGHEFTVYQIFTGSMAVIDGKDTLGDVKYGKNYGTEGDAVPNSELSAITDAEAFARELYAGGELNGFYGTLSSDNSWKIENVPAGYYLIVDTTPAADMPDYDTRSSYIVQVVGDVAIAPKNTTTTFEKKLKDINDSEDASIEDNQWQDSADHDIGDVVPYQITATFSDMADAEKFSVDFTDTMSKGLTFNEDLTVSMTYTYKDASGAVQTKTVDVTSAFPIQVNNYAGTEEKYEGGKVYELGCDDVKALVSENIISAKFVVSYTCTLNEQAKLGEPGNPNKAKMEFDREPDHEGEGEGETPDDTCIVFTYKVESNKYANEVKEGNELTGAGFTLYKWDAATNDWEQIGEEVTGEAMTKFEWKGIDDGKYKLVETTTPAGYNTIDPIEFEVVASHVLVDPNPTLTNLTGDTKTGEVEFSADASNGLISTDVINNSGTILPETGGVGTTIFYILGAAMAICAVVVLVSRRRMTAEG